jgi:hypothetical protein
MNAKKTYVPPRLTLHGWQESLVPAPHSRRVYARYAFAAEAKVITSNQEIVSEVRNISLAGCLLQIKTPIRVGAEVTVQIDRDSDHFEAKATVVRCFEDTAGLMFVRFVGNSLFVLGKWVAEAKEKVTAQRTARP